MSALRRSVALYADQIRLLWNWRPGRWALVRHALVSLVIMWFAFRATATLFPQLLDIGALGNGLVAAFLLGVINLALRPVVLALVAQRSVIAIGIATILLQAVAILLLDRLLDFVSVSNGFLGALVVSLVIGVIVTALSAIVGLGAYDSYYGALVRTIRSRGDDVDRTDAPGLVIVQIDGLSKDVLAHAVRAGRVPNISTWVQSGSHQLVQWDSLLPSTTPAGQAGILHGNNDDIPNFRWWDKASRRLFVANHPADATEVERRISNGQGLLSNGGASIGNLFSGDAERAFLTMSAIKVKEQGLGRSEAFAWFLTSPYDYLNVAVRFVVEFAKERYQARRQARARIWPRIRRGSSYAFARAATNVGLRAIGTSLVIQEMMRGTPVIYIDYTDYDEIAHHSGPERPEALDALDGVDRELGTLRRAAAEAARPYVFVALADHGQSLGATFLQRYGTTLQDVVHRHMSGKASIEAATAAVEDEGRLDNLITEVGQTRGVSGRLSRAVRRRRPVAQERESTGGSSTTPAVPQPPDVVVAAGGNLAHIYFTAKDIRMTFEEIERLHPGLVGALSVHPGIGLVMVRSETSGPACVGVSGVRYLDGEQVTGHDPLAQYGEYADAALRRLDAMGNVGDLVVISQFDPLTEGVAAFEELVGSHGGLGGPQNRPFLLHPTEWKMDAGPLVGAPAVHGQIRMWMERELGFTFGAGDPGGTT
jgi:uncharacterized membrane protein YvlD (DUF360 family)